MLCHLMQNKSSSVSAELEKDLCEGVEMRELNDKDKFTSQFLYFYSQLQMHFYFGGVDSKKHYLFIMNLFIQ